MFWIIGISVLIILALFFPVDNKGNEDYCVCSEGRSYECHYCGEKIIKES